MDPKIILSADVSALIEAGRAMREALEELAAAVEAAGWHKSETEEAWNAIAKAKQIEELNS